MAVHVGQEERIPGKFAYCFFFPSNHEREKCLCRGVVNDVTFAPARNLFNLPQFISINDNSIR